MKPASRFNGRYIEGAGGTKLFVEELGDPARPAILWIHGFTQSRLCWDRQFDSQLAAQFHLVRFDCRGHGLSDKPEDITAYQQSKVWADDLNAIITTLQLKRPVLCGWSYGGVIISDYIRYYGEQNLAGLILIAATTELGGKENSSRLSPEFVQLFSGLTSTDFSIGSQALQQLTDIITHQPLDPHDFHLFLGISAVTTPITRQGMFKRKVSNTDLLKNLSIPALILHGQNDRLVLPTYSDYLAHHIPHARRLNYEECGHAPFFEHPDRFNEDVAEFMRSL
jgi:pimeloyl-ACP methyl ester carboxylesterase